MTTDSIEQYAKLLHKDSCVRRGEIPYWNGKGTNRAYWRRKARAPDEAASPESLSVSQDEPIPPNPLTTDGAGE